MVVSATRVAANATPCMSGSLGLCNRRNGNLEAGNSHRELGALACRRISGKPLQPFGVHACKIVFLREDDGGADHFIQGATGFLENGLDVGQALGGLFLDGGAGNSARVWIVWADARDKY